MAVCVCVCVCVRARFGMRASVQGGGVGMRVFGEVDFQALEKVGRTDGNVGVAVYMKQSYGEGEGRD